MKISKLYFGKLRNAEHFQFFTEFRDLVNLFGADPLKVQKFFTSFLSLFAVEDECLMVLQKSGYTEQMADADTRRDSTFRGLADTVNAALKHFNPDTVAAGKRLKILFDTYGNLAQKPADEETSGIYNLVQDLEDKFAADVQHIGAADWVAELKANNQSYVALVKSRDKESAEKPETRMKAVRTEIEAVYRDTTAAVESLAKLTDSPEETAMYREFILKLNTVVERYRNRIAQREGAAAAKKNKSEEAAKQTDNE